MNPIYIPADAITDWQKLLADPQKHWRAGYSAMEIAEAWHHATGFPSAVSAVLRGAGEPLQSLAPLMIVPEHKVDLPPRGRPSQNDVWVLARNETDLASITIEGKVAETFGPTVAEWQQGGSDGKRERLNFLTATLGLGANIAGDVRYQLLHRTASAIIEAKRFHARIAIMLVHSFSAENIGLRDYQAFVQLFGGAADVNKIVQLPASDGLALYVGWVQDAIRSR